MAAIDPQVMADLRALQAGGSPTFLSELIDIFLKEQAQHLARLRKAFDSRDAGVLERVAHTMKGSCGNLGARELSRICAELQGVARAGDWARAESLVLRIETDALGVESELRAEKSRPS
ncbi:MAG TPA: Hpt domain-containing protein [Planctomycetota bacterium]|nr:Hpt domain-containing protein [Planctomycetota bacterium]